MAKILLKNECTNLIGDLCNWDFSDNDIKGGLTNLPWSPKNQSILMY